MTVNAITSAPPATTSSSSNALSSLTSNFETFLSLLTTELQNQDPTDPTDTSTYITQISQMAMVEAQIESNSKLDTLVSQGKNAAASSAVDYVGKKVTLVNGCGVISDGKCDWTYALGSNAASTTLTVTDSSGNTVYTASGDTSAGSHTLDWDGTTSSGGKETSGTYILTVTAKDSAGNKIATAVGYTGTVAGVDLTGPTAQLIIGASEFSLSNIGIVGN